MRYIRHKALNQISYGLSPADFIYISGIYTLEPLYITKITSGFYIHSWIELSLLNKNIPFPCDLAVGFIIQILLLFVEDNFLNYSQKLENYKGRWKVNGAKLYLRFNLFILCSLFITSLSLQISFILF